MKLSELHKRLSQKPSYRKAYDAIGDVVLIGAAVRKLREEAEVNQEDLAHRLSISAFYLSRLETASGKVPPAVVATVVHHFEKPLRKLGINVEPWLNMELPKPEPKKESSNPGFRNVGLPEAISRVRDTVLTRKLADVVREKPSHKYGSSH